MSREKEENLYQIIRKDAKNCFVEVLNDSFAIGRAHLFFATYDLSKPKNQRYTNTVDIYLPMSEVVELCRKLETGIFGAKVKEYKANKDSSSLYESLGGISAKRLKEKGKQRKDKKSLSRVMNIIAGQKADIMLIAESGAGEESDKGLIVPKFGDKPENKVVVSMPFASFSEMMLMTKMHFSAWLAGWYQHRSAVIKAQRQAQEKEQDVEDEEDSSDALEDGDDMDDYDDIE
jgi:hypothetical protein